MDAARDRIRDVLDTVERSIACGEAPLAVLLCLREELTRALEVLR
jgi:hypothetical protein